MSDAMPALRLVDRLRGFMPHSLRCRIKRSGEGCDCGVDAALAVVEAEMARLREELLHETGMHAAMKVAAEKWAAKAKAVEAEMARLRGWLKQSSDESLTWAERAKAAERERDARPTLEECVDAWNRAVYGVPAGKSYPPPDWVTTLYAAKARAQEGR